MRILILLALLLTACSPGTTGNKKLADLMKTENGAPAPEPDQPPPDVLDTPSSGDPSSVAALNATVGIRSFEEIHATMAALTGITGNTTINSRYNNLKSKLSVDNDVKSFSFSVQNAITTLAAEYCNALVNNGSYAGQRQASMGPVNTGAAPATAFANGADQVVARTLLNKFWGAGYSSLPNGAQTEATITTLIADLVNGETANSTTTKKALVGACTSVLASSPVSSI